MTTPYPEDAGEVVIGTVNDYGPKKVEHIESRDAEHSRKG